MKYDPKIVSAYYVQNGLPKPEFEYKIIDARKYVWDICFPKFKVWIEVQGGIFSRGRSGHSSISGLLRDFEKHNLATLAGWRGLYILPQEVCMLDTVKTIKGLIYE